MKFLFLLSLALLPFMPIADASCAADVDYDKVVEESEQVFVGTVDRLENYNGPQKVHFIIQQVIKGIVDTPRYMMENHGTIYHEDGSVESSSVSMDYEIGKTYKVYVVNGDTSMCTTQQLPLYDYFWQPGPESGKYETENPVWEDPCPEGYGVSNGECVTLEEMNKDSPDHRPGPAPEPNLHKEYFERECKNGMFLAYKVDYSKSACVTPNTLHELIERDWAFSHANRDGITMSAKSTETFSITCEKNQIPVNAGYRLYEIENAIEVINIQENVIDGYPGFTVTLENLSENDIRGHRSTPLSVWIDCVDPTVNSFDECIDASNFTTSKNWPILECRTLDGQSFSYNEVEEMAKN